MIYKVYKNYIEHMSDSDNNIDIDVNDFKSGFDSQEDFDKFRKERDTQLSVIEESKTYIWTRVFLKSEDDTLKKGDKVYLKHAPTDEVLETMFVSYNKGNSSTDSDEDDKDDVQNYTDEEDKKVLCLAIDLNYVNKRDNDIPFIKTIFRESYFYDDNFLKMSEWSVYSIDNMLDFYTIEF